MSIIDKLTKTKEEPKQYSIIQEFKQELNNYKTSISSLDKSQKEKLEGFFANGLIGIENNISHLPDNIQTKFKNIVSNLSNPNIEVSGQDIDFIVEVLDSLAKESKEIESNFVVALEQNDLLALQESIKEVKSTKKQLSTLKHSISGNVNTEFPQLAKKAEKYVEQIKKFKTEHKYRTKALFLLIPKPILAVLFKNEKTNNTDLESVKNIGEKLGIGNIGAILNQMKGFMTTLLTWVFDLPFIGAPKEMREFLHNIKKDFGALSQEQLAQIKSMVKGGLSEKEVGIEKVSKEELEQANNGLESMLRKVLPDYIEKMSGKKLSPEEIENLIKEMDLKSLLKGDTENIKGVLKALQGKDFDSSTNILGAGFEGITLPAKIFVRITSVLYKHNYVTSSNLGVYFAKKSKEIFLGTFGLLGSGIELLKGEISGKDFDKQIKEILDVDPTIGKEILAIMLYRHGGLVFSTVGAISEYMGKLIISSLTGESSVINNVKDALKGEINEYTRILKKIQNILPNDLKIPGMSNFISIVDELEEANQAIKILKQNPNIDGKTLVEKIEKATGKKVSFLSGIEKVSPTDLKSNLSARIEKIGFSLDKNIGIIESTIGSKFKGMNSEKAVLDQVSKSIKKQTSILSTIVKDDTFGNRVFGSNIAKLKSILALPEVDYIHDKMTYKFKDVKTAKDYFKNIGILAKQSPELVKFLFDKMPIFAVVGLSAANETTLKEFGKELIYLVPLIGSGFMLYDALYLKDPNYTQASIASILLASETGYLLYKGAIKDGKAILDYMLKPGRDIIDIMSFASKTMSHTGKFVVDGYKLIKNGKFSYEEFTKVLQKFPKLLSKFKGRVGFILLALFGTYELAFADDNFKKDTEQLKKECGNNRNCMDEKIKQMWNDLDYEEKSQFISLSILLKENYNTEVDYENGIYHIRLNQNNNNIPNYPNFRLFLSRIKDIVSMYGENNLNIQLGFSSKLIEKIKQENGLDTKEKFEIYFSTRGYPDKLIERLWESN